MRRDEGDFSMSKAKPRRWNALFGVSDCESIEGRIECTWWSQGEREVYQDERFATFQGNIFAVLKQWQILGPQLFGIADQISIVSQLESQERQTSSSSRTSAG